MKNRRIIAILTAIFLLIVLCLLMTACNGDLTVTFKGDGIETFTQKVKKGEPISQPTAPTRNGYTFKGWQDDNGEDWDFETPVKQDITLTAVWSANESKITLNPNGGNLNGGGRSTP